MKKLCGLLLTALIMLYACQKEVSYENGNGLSAEGTLQSEVTGDCLPKEVAGTYEAGVELISTANAIEVTVNVTKTGPYLIYTDTVNGYFFRSSGNFTATGLTTVTLPGKGKPEIEGIDNFRVIFNTSECILPVTVGGLPAEFTFSGGPGSCMDFSTSGDYVVGVDLNSSNTVNIKLNVTVAGSYTISTNASNGMTFSSTGFVQTGEQIITLTGSGKPVNTGVTPIPISYNGSSCSFSVEVLATPPPAKDYFPRTPASNWSYEWNDDVNDSIIYRSDPGGPQTIGSNSYNIFGAKDETVPDFVPLAGYRKSGNDYFIYTDLAYWLGFDANQEVEFLFLKDNANIGDTWNTAVYTGARNGTSVKVRIRFVVTQKNVVTSFTASTGPQSFSNTIVVEEHYDIQQPDNSFKEDDSFYKHYYAEGVGLVLEEIYATTNPATPTARQELRRYQVVP